MNAVKTREEGWSRVEAQKQQSTGQLLLKCARLLDETAVARVNRAGVKPALRPAHTRLLPHIDKEGTRLTELARRVGITKQAVGQLVDELSTLGALDVVPDPTDGRARLVRFTARGVAAIQQGLGVLAQLEQELAREVGAKRLRQLNELLSELLPALQTLRGQAGRQ
jgi:DNA-binding MarR family transcriptional regulator